MTQRNTKRLKVNVIEIGERISVNTARGESFKHEVQCSITDESGDHEFITFDIWANNPGMATLEVGSDYEVTVAEAGNPKYNGTIYDVLEAGSGAKAPAAPSKQAPAKAPTPKPSGLGTRTPDFGKRWDQWNMHARTAQMQASERVGHYVQLAIAGKLSQDGKTATSLIKKETIESWYGDEIKRYWDELDIEKPRDAYGDLVGGE